MENQEKNTISNNENTTERTSVNENTNNTSEVKNIRNTERSTDRNTERSTDRNTENTYTNRQGQGSFGGNRFGGNSGNNRRMNNGRRPFRKEKYDKIASEKLNIDYKHPEILKRFLTDKGRIFSRYITGNSAKNQRRLVREVKRARFIGLLPSA